MRKLALISLIVIFSHGIILAQATMFRVFCEPGAYTEAIVTYQQQDSTYISAANTTGFDDFNQIYLLRLDTGGNFIEDHAIALPGLSRARSMILQGYNSSAFCGLAQDSSTQSYDGLFACVDPSWQLTTYRSYGGPDWDDFNSLARMPDGGFCFGGFTYSYGQGGADAWIVRTDSLGDTLWTYVYGNTDDDIIHDIAPAPWGLVACGYSVDTAVGSTDILIIAMNDVGDTLWVKHWGSPLGDIGYSLVVTSDSGVVVAGSTEGFSAVFSDGIFVKFDKDGNYLWHELYPGSQKDKLTDIILISGDSLSAGGTTTSFGAGREDFSLFLTLPDGWWYGGGSYGGFGHDFFHAISQTLDGGYILTGSSTSFGVHHQGMLIAKTDQMGFTVTGTVVISGLQEYDFQGFMPYPNPTTGILKLPPNIEKVTVYDLRARKLMDAIQPIQSINLENLPTGIYLVEIMANNQRRTYKITKH